MKGKSVRGVVKGVGRALKKRSPELLTGIGIGGMLTTTFLAVKATPKALLLIEQEKDKIGEEKLTPVETVKATWLCYIPAAVTGVVSIICLIGASATNSRRNAALAAAYTLSESAFKEYREKVVETIGEKKEKAIRDDVARDKVTAAPLSEQRVIFTGKGDTLCYDVLSGQYFRSDIEKIRRAINELNRTLVLDGAVSLNDLYYLLGLRSTKLGDDLGWNVNKCLVEPSFHSILAEGEEPCLVIDYQVAPTYDYSRW